MIRRSPFLVVWVALLGCVALHAWADDAPAPAAIAPPPGCVLMFKLKAAGVQIYQAVQGDAGLRWKFVSPLANLCDDTGAIVAWHYDGPTWEGSDGSRIAHKPGSLTKSAAAPHAATDVPWLLLAVESNSQLPGRFSPAVFVQRRDTHGGQAPAQPPVQIGAKIGVPYTAVYYFFKKAQ